MNSYRFVNPTTLAIGLLVALTTTQAKADDGANEAAWFNHLKHANDYHVQAINTGRTNYYGFYDKWDALMEGEDESLTLTQGDFKTLSAKLGGKINNAKSSLDKLNYQADFSDKLMQVRLFYHF